MSNEARSTVLLVSFPVVCSHTSWGIKMNAGGNQDECRGESALVCCVLGFLHLHQQRFSVGTLLFESAWRAGEGIG